MSQKTECPKCLGVLEHKEVGELKGEPVFIDQCPLCQGIWFDKGELWKVLKGQITFDQEEAEKDFRPDFTGDVFDLKEAQCPCCHKRMERVKSLQDDRVQTDYCLSCGGTWLDGGEVRLLMRGGPLKRAVRFVLDKISTALEGLRGPEKMRE